jgi:hypothetical protein
MLGGAALSVMAAKRKIHFIWQKDRRQKDGEQFRLILPLLFLLKLRTPTVPGE